MLHHSKILFYLTSSTSFAALTCFAGQKHKMHEKFHRKALYNTDLRKGIIEKPINLNLSGQNTHQVADQEPSPTHHTKVVARGPGQGSADPQLVPLCRPLEGRWHEGMQKAVKHVLCAKYSCTHHLTCCINRGATPPLNTHLYT
jgi:hypothetical protein